MWHALEMGNKHIQDGKLEGKENFEETKGHYRILKCIYK
jgi:hypothetical protein